MLRWGVWIGGFSCYAAEWKSCVGCFCACMWTQKAEHGCGRQEAASASNGFPSIASRKNAAHFSWRKKYINSLPGPMLRGCRRPCLACQIIIGSARWGDAHVALTRLLDRFKFLYMDALSDRCKINLFFEGCKRNLAYIIARNDIIMSNMIWSLHISN